MVGVSRSRSADRIVAEPGPLDDEHAECDWCSPFNARDAVYRVPDPNYDIHALSALCEYHLAVLKREHELRWRDLLEHPDLHGLDEARAEHVLIERDDVPDEVPIDGTLYQRLGLDERGVAYFIVELGEDAVRVVQTDERFDILQSDRVRCGELRGFIDHIGTQFRWRGLESKWIDRADAWDERVRVEHDLGDRDE